MKRKRAEEFINGHTKIGNLQFTVADIEYCVMLAEQDAEEEIEALKARAAEAYRTHRDLFVCAVSQGTYILTLSAPDGENLYRRQNL